MILCPALYIYVHTTQLLSYAIRFSFILYLAFFVFRASRSLFPFLLLLQHNDLFSVVIFFQPCLTFLCAHKNIHRQTESGRKKQTNTVASWFIQPNAQIFGLTVCGCCVCVCACECVYVHSTLYTREHAWVSKCFCLSFGLCVRALFTFVSRLYVRHRIDRCARAFAHHSVWLWFKLSDHWSSHNSVLIILLDFRICVFVCVFLRVLFFSFGSFATYSSSSFSVLFDTTFPVN